MKPYSHLRPSQRLVRSAAVIAVCLASLTAIASPVAAQTLDAEAAAGTRRALIICGHPGDKEHRKPFAETVEKLQQALVGRLGFAADEVRVQFGGPIAEGEGPVLKDVRGGATRDEIEAEAADLHSRLQPDDTLWVIVIGHAHYDGRHAFLNLPGPDLHEQDFGKLFEGLACREQVFFMTNPASGFYIKPLSAQGRVVITATEADLEVNETLYPHALAEVLAGPWPENFDVDQDGVATLFDVYIAVARNVADRYFSTEILPTEHALLDDNGDRRGTEVQIDYLTVEQGGRAIAGKAPPQRRETADGAFSARLRLSVVFEKPALAE